MKLIGVDTEALKQHFGKKIMELEEEKRIVQVGLDIFNYLNLDSYQMPHKKYVSIFTLVMILEWQWQKERDRLLHEVENLAANCDGLAHKTQDARGQKLKALEAQVNFHLHWCHSQVTRLSFLANIFLIYLFVFEILYIRF